MLYKNHWHGGFPLNHNIIAKKERDCTTRDNLFYRIRSALRQQSRKSKHIPAALNHRYEPRLNELRSLIRSKNWKRFVSDKLATLEDVDHSDCVPSKKSRGKPDKGMFEF